MSEELRAMFAEKVESGEDENIIGTYTDKDGVVVVLVLDEPLALQYYGCQENVRYVVSKPFYAYADHISRIRPAPGGVSTGNFRITAGTLSLVVRDKTDGSLAVLSNNHVYANVDNCQVGDNLLQPGSVDGGRNPDDTIADLTRWIPMRTPAGSKKVDCAIGKVKNDADVTLNIMEIGYQQFETLWQMKHLLYEPISCHLWAFGNILCPSYSHQASTYLA